MNGEMTMVVWKWSAIKPQAALSTHCRSRFVMGLFCAKVILRSSIWRRWRHRTLCFAKACERACTSHMPKSILLRRSARREQQGRTGVSKIPRSVRRRMCSRIKGTMPGRVKVISWRIGVPLVDSNTARPGRIRSPLSGTQILRVLLARSAKPQIL